MKINSRIAPFLALFAIFACCHVIASDGKLPGSPAEVNARQQKIAEFNQPVATNPKDAQEYCVRAFLHNIWEEYRQAIEDANHAISILPSCRAYQIRGCARTALGQVQEGIEDFDEAIHLDPKDYCAYSDRAFAHGLLGKYEKEIDDCNSAIELHAYGVVAFVYRASAYGELRQYEKEIDDCSQAIAIAPRCTAAYLARGRAFAHLGHYDKAVRDFGAAMFSLYDATSIAILLPSLLLWLLLIAASRKKRVLPQKIDRYLLLHNPFFTVIKGAPPECYPAKQLHPPLIGQIAIYLIAILWAGCVLGWCSLHSSWKEDVHWVNCCFLNVRVCILCTLPIFYGLQFLNHQKMLSPKFRNMTFGTGALFNTFVLAWLLLWLLPSMILLMSPATSIDYWLLKLLTRISVSLSTVASSLAGITLACLAYVHIVVGRHGAKLANDYKLLTSDAFNVNKFATMTDQALHDLTSLALTVGDLEKADLLSQFLLERAEKSNSGTAFA